MSSNIKDFWTSVIVFQDLVAIDNMGVNFLLNEPTVTYLNGALRGNPKVENYLREAELVGDVLSGTMYADSQGNIGVTWVPMNIETISKRIVLHSRKFGKSEEAEMVYFEKRFRSK